MGNVCLAKFGQQFPRQNVRITLIQLHRECCISGNVKKADKRERTSTTTDLIARPHSFRARMRVVTMRREATTLLRRPMRRHARCLRRLECRRDARTDSPATGQYSLAVVTYFGADL